MDRQLHEIPVERLKEAAGGRIRFKTLGEASIVTVYDALHPRYPLSAIHGISDTMAAQRETLDGAEGLLTRLHAAGVRGQLRDFSECVEASRSALDVLQNRRGPLLRRRWTQL